MSDTEIVKFLAEKVMGWTPTHLTPQGAQWFDCGNGARRAYWDGCPGGGAGKFNPLTFIADAFEVQAAIPENWQREYGVCLYHEVREHKASQSPDGWVASNSILDWDMASATPRQRSIAAVKALGGTV